MSVPKWTEERESALMNFVGDETPVSQETVAEAAEALETTPRSISSKLRKMEYEVEKAGGKAQRAFTDEEAEVLATFVTDNSGAFTYADIAKNFAGGKFTPKQIQGKILSMELTEHVARAPKPETVRTYTPEQEELFVKMVNEGAYVEAIAKAMGKPENSVRGKALSLLRTGVIDAIPRQEFTKASAKTDPLSELGDVSEMTVANIAEAIEKTERGVKTMLTRRGLVAADWDGAARREKAHAND